MTWTFLLTALVICVTPGTGALFTLAAALGRGAVFVAMTFVVFTGYALAAAAVRGQVLARPRVVQRIRRTFAASFVVLSGRLALDSR